MEKIGFITTIPVEIIFASGNVPVDLNNKFINAPDAARLVNDAEDFGFPRNFCSWVKGAFTVAQQMGIKKIIMVREGECTYSEKLSEVFEFCNIEIIPFSYPQSREYDSLHNELKKLYRYFDVDEMKVYETKRIIDAIRKKVHYLDTLSYTRFNVTGSENFLSLITSTDFDGDFFSYERMLDSTFSEIQTRDEGSFASYKKIGVIGIPPIINNLFTCIEEMQGIVVFNEMPRQFAMTNYDGDFVEQYRHFTYPYNISYRIADIKNEIKVRKLDGIIHYVQSFCPKQVDDMLFRKEINVPYLTIECDSPGTLDERNLTRLEAFFERLHYV